MSRPRLAATLVAVLVLAGCAGGGGDATAPSAATTGAPATVTTPPVPDDPTPTTPEGWRRVAVVEGLSFAVPEGFAVVPGATANPAGVELDAGTNDFLHTVAVDQAVVAGGDAGVADLDGYREVLFAGREPDDVAWDEATYRGLPAARFGELSPSGDVALEGFAVLTPEGILVLSRHVYLFDEDDPHAEVPFETYLAALDLDPGAIPPSFWLGA